MGFTLVVSFVQSCLAVKSGKKSHNQDQETGLGNRGRQKVLHNTKLILNDFTYRARVLFPFKEIDGVNVCFFGMHIQDYESILLNMHVKKGHVHTNDFFESKQCWSLVRNIVLEISENTLLFSKLGICLTYTGVFTKKKIN